ncbi:MAG TPA: prolyl oligopeptidase family serine peptidase [Pyrinomonadaceae bacterium]|nr:prolyl oligopeptidase family serine peptidase [Pyrinomonadaceae bacterium]
MKKVLIANFALIAVIGLALSLAVSDGNSQRKPLPPRNANGPGDKPTTPGKPECTTLKDCTAWDASAPKQLHVGFAGPNNMKLYGHLYVPGVTTRAQLDALSKPANKSSISTISKLTKLYPAVIYNHGSEAVPKGVHSLAKLYVDLGYVFFAPDRHGQGLSKDAGPYIVDLEQASGDPEKSVELHELYNLDVIAALEWLKQQPYIDKRHLIMTGISYGGIQTLLTAEKDPGIGAYLPFTPAAESWPNPFLQKRLIKAVNKEKAPMFLLQAEGDYSLGPIETLGPLLDAKGDSKLWKAKLYPKFGCTNQDAHGAFAARCDGIAIWSDDALKFIERAFK